MMEDEDFMEVLIWPLPDVDVPEPDTLEEIGL